MNETAAAECSKNEQMQDDTLPCIDITCLTIAECTPVADQIRQHLLSAPKLQLKLSNCEEIDTAGVQLLSILRCDEGVSSRVMFDSPSEVAMQAISLLGLTSLFTPDPHPV